MEGPLTDLEFFDFGGIAEKIGIIVESVDGILDCAQESSRCDPRLWSVLDGCKCILSHLVLLVEGESEDFAVFEKEVEERLNLSKR